MVFDNKYDCLEVYHSPVFFFNIQVVEFTVTKRNFERNSLKHRFLTGGPWTPKGFVESV